MMLYALQERGSRGMTNDSVLFHDAFCNSDYRQFELRLARIMCSHVHGKRELTNRCDLRH